MDERIIELSRKLRFNSGASIKLLADIQSKLDVLFPADYIEFMLHSDGAVGFVGNSYLAIWPAADILPRNEGHIANAVARNLILFGSDGGGMAYAFDVSLPKLSIVEIDFVVMDTQGTRVRVSTLRDFLENLYKRD